MRQTTESGCLLPLLAKKCGLERSAVDRDEGARRLSAAGPAERPEEDLPGSSEKRWNKPPLPNIRRDGNSPFTCEPASCIEPFPISEGLLFLAAFGASPYPLPAAGRHCGADDGDRALLPEVVSGEWLVVKGRASFHH